MTMITNFEEAFEAFESLADDDSKAAQIRYAAAENFLLTTPPSTMKEAALALLCIVASLAAGGRSDGLELAQSARVQRLMLSGLAV